MKIKEKKELWYFNYFLKKRVEHNSVRKNKTDVDMFAYQELKCILDCWEKTKKRMGIKFLINEKEK